MQELEKVEEYGEDKRGEAKNRGKIKQGVM